MTLSDVLGRESHWYKRWTAITLIAGGIVLLGQVFGAFSVLEPIFPAHREYVRTQVALASEPLKLEQTGVIALVQKQLDEKFRMVQSDVDVKVGAILNSQFDLSILVLDGRASSLRGELASLSVQLQDNPRDLNLLSRQAELQSELRDIERQIRQTKCLANPGSAFCQ